MKLAGNGPLCSPPGAQKNKGRYEEQDVKASAIWITGLMVTLTIAGCSRQEEILAGERFGTRVPLSEAFPADAGALTEEEVLAASQETVEAPDPLLSLRREASEDVSVPISLPAATNRSSWTHRGGDASHYAGHLQLGAAPARVWSTRIGNGNSRKYRISSDPVIAGDRVFALDSQAGVTAMSLAGDVLWRADLTPASDRNSDASGGGLAYGDGALYVTTGFGRLTALDAADGSVRWEQRFDAPITGAPTVNGDLVYVTARDNTIAAVRTANGRLAWSVNGAPSNSTMITGAGPAAQGDTVVFPSGVSELIAARPEGVRVWAASLAGQRRGFAYAGISDITGDPVIRNGAVYAATQSGRFAKLDQATGERIWTATDGAYSPGLPVGGSVFIVSDQGQLVRLDDATGEVIWTVDLPYYRRSSVRRLKSVTSHFGPILAGGQLVVGSDDGSLRFFSPEDGSLRYETKLPGGAASMPAVANGTLYILSGNGQMHAFR